MLEKRPVKILLLDDEPFMLKLLTRMLANQGFNAVTAFENGFSALDEINQADIPPDLILMDINMPAMDGVEFLRKLEEHGYTGSIILISGEDEQVARATAALAHSYNIPVLARLTKPVSPALLTAALNKWSPIEQNPAAQHGLESYNASAIRDAIVQGELVNHYQPIVALHTGRVVGVETLVRWQHPEDGLLLPGQFINTAKEHGLIMDLTREVLIAAMRQAGVWQSEGRLLHVSINVTPQDMTSPDFCDIVFNLATEAGLSPQGVHLEIQEGPLLNNSSPMLETLTRLRIKRFRVSIDDFGIVHCSPSQLRNFPFDEVKLDRSLVHGGTVTSTENYNASLRLAKQLDARVVGKGVENLNDWDLLRRTGCDFAQGYFIGKPMPAAEIAAWMKNWHTRVNNGFRNDSILSEPSSAK